MQNIYMDGSQFTEYTQSVHKWRLYLKIPDKKLLSEVIDLLYEQQRNGFVYINKQTINVAI